MKKHSTPTISTPRKHQWLRSGKMHLAALLVVVAVGVLAALATRNTVVAANAKNAKKNDNAVAAAQRLEARALARLIDQRITARLKSNEVAASERCTDAEFIRRAYLDITGVIPPAEKVRAFLDSKDSNKRAKLIDELLDNPRYGKFFAEIWTNALLPDETNNRRLKEKPLQDWLAQKFNSNTPWDKIVYDIVTASGPVDKNGAVTFFVGNPAVDKITNQITQRFLGVQLQCAQCHNHPFTDWKQDEYWGMAAFFQKTGVNGNPNQAAKKGYSLQVQEVNLQNLRGKKGRRKGKAKAKRRFRIFRIPKDGKRVPPKFLTANQPKLDRSEPYRPVVAKWMVSKQNRFFTRAIVNKTWGHFFGRGIVNPIDDMHDDNPATHPELLKEMAEQMKANNFDMKYLIRAICLSETYQHSSRPKGNNGDDKELFSHTLVRAMSPQQLYDSLEAVVKTKNVPQRGKGRRKKAVRRRGAGPREQFIKFFSTDDGYKPLEYQAGIPQALRLMNSPQMNATNRVVAQVLQDNKTPAKIIEHLYLSTLSRRPTQAEMQRMTQHVQQGNARTAYADILWALLNSSEFATNH